MVDNIDGLLKVYEAVIKSGLGEAETNRDQIEVLQGVCYVISELPIERVHMAMQTLIEQMAKWLLEIAQQPTRQVDKKVVCKYL